MDPWLLAGIVVIALIVIVRRVRGEPVNPRDLFVPPVVLLVIGGIGLSRPLTGVDVTWIAVCSAVGFGLGLVRGTTPMLFTRNGVLWQRYTGWTFAVWVLSLAVNGGLDLLATANGMHHDA
ncbi:DUF1453 domain-containing protein, partial [Kibdelosporangium lantanae]